MRRRLLLAVALAAAMLASATAAATAATAPIGASMDQQARFPERRLLVTLPAGVQPYQVSVTENGVPVIPHLAPVSRSRVPVSVVVALDTSDSMRGAKLRDALDAAQTLIAAKPDRSEVELIGFAAQPETLHPWTADPGASMAALAGVKTSAGTAIWDTVTTAAQQLGSRAGAARVIVLLTDGMDTSSAGTLDEAIAAAERYHAHVDAVGLPGAPATATLRHLASATGGEFIQVSSLDQLHGVYAGLAARLSHQYVLTYASQMRGTGHEVRVRVAAAGSSVTTGYVIPSLRRVAAPEAHGWWATRTAVAAVAAVVGLAILLAAYAALRPKPRRASAQLRAWGAPQGGRTPVAIEMIERPRRTARPGSRHVWQRFGADVERGEIGKSPTRVLLVAVTVGTVAAGVAAAVTGVPYVVVAGPLLGALGAWIFVTRRASAWYRHFDEALADHLVVLSSSLRAGHSLLQAVAHVAEEADERTAAEWNELVHQTRVGISVEDALDNMCERVGNRDLQWIALVVRVQHQVGGNMAEMFDIVADTVRQRHRLRAQIQTLTAQGRMTRWILVAAPFGIGGVVFLLSPQYVLQFLADPAGRLMIAIAAVLIVIGSLWLKKIVEIEV
ncbi:MAG TPA: VWA domain-containing protein [Gaiellales bacterium]|nr:VWA domain-containing protein [Gaiellales bacterium]